MRAGARPRVLMRFKQVCNHPAQLRGDGRSDPAESGKFARLAEIAEEIAGRQERVLVFTQFREMADPLAVPRGASSADRGWSPRRHRGARPRGPGRRRSSARTVPRSSCCR